MVTLVQEALGHLSRLLKLVVMAKTSQALQKKSKSSEIHKDKHRLSRTTTNMQ